MFNPEEYGCFEVIELGGYRTMRFWGYGIIRLGVRGV